MMVAVRTLLQRLLALGKQWWQVPGLRTAARAAGLAGSGFLASAASLRASPQPLAMGLILGTTGWQSLCLCLGAMAGYRYFWADAGNDGLWWALLAGILALLGLPQRVLPVLGLLAVGLAGLFLPGRSSAEIFLLRLGVAGGSIWIFPRRDRTGRWLQCAAVSLALAQVAPTAWLGLGYAAAGALGVAASFPAAALAGLGLDMAGITRVPMTAVMVVAWMGKLLPGTRKIRWILPGAAGLGLMAATGVWDFRILPGLVLGGAGGLLLRGAPAVQPHRRETGPAQVRLELAAGAMEELRRGLLSREPQSVDREALLQRVRTRACGNCSARRTCLEQERLTATVLEDMHPFPCRKPGRLRPELTRARDQLRLMRADHRRREEYRQALAKEYRNTGELLRQLADRLPRRSGTARARYGVTVAVRTRGKGSFTGDRWAAFPGSRSRYFVLLCDGMGTGPGALEEGKNTVRLLRRLLTAEFPPEQALGSVNSMLALSGRAGAVTVDLAELRLDTGQARLYKWGAAPSWRVAEGKAQKIGTATPPPGLSASEGREWQGRLSLKGGVMLILVSDGVDGEAVPRRVYTAPDAPPGELAERLLEGGQGKPEDDATAAVIRLYPLGTATS